VKTLIEALLALALVAGWAMVALQADRAMAGTARAAAPTVAGDRSGDASQRHLAALFGHRAGEQLDERVDRVDVRRGRVGQATELHH